MATDNRFSKWQWITTDLVKATGDPRPESYKLNADTIKVEDKVGTADNWQARRDILKPLVRKSMCDVRSEQEQNGGSPTLAVFKPDRIKRLIIEDEENPDWTSDQLNILKQDDLFQKAPKQTLEKIPFKFKYEFACGNAGCNGHTMSCTDWEIAEAYRNWRSKYGERWESAFRQRFEREMIEKNDTHFMVGTVHKHPNNWIIVGLFYPPKRLQSDMFD